MLNHHFVCVPPCRFIHMWGFSLCVYCVCTTSNISLSYSFILTNEIVQLHILHAKQRLHNTFQHIYKDAHQSRAAKEMFFTFPKHTMHPYEYSSSYSPNSLPHHVHYWLLLQPRQVIVYDESLHHHLTISLIDSPRSSIDDDIG